MRRDPASLAAYRALAANEMPAAVVYRQRRTETADAFATELLVKTWLPGPTRLRLTNPAPEKFGYRVLTPNAAANSPPANNVSAKSRCRPEWCPRCVCCLRNASALPPSRLRRQRISRPNF